MSDPVTSPLANVVRQFPWWNSFISWFVGVFLLMTLAWMGALVAWTHMRQEEELIGKFGLALEHIAVTAAPFIHGDDLAAIRSAGDEQTNEFQRARQLLSTIAEENDLEEDQIYILRQNSVRGDQYDFVVMLQERTFIGDTYDPPQAVHSLYHWVMTENDGVRTDLYIDANGSYISGLAPIRNSDDEAVAILQVDYPVRAYLEQIRQLTTTLVSVALGSSSIVLIFALFLHRRLRKKVAVLLHGTWAIEQQNYDHRVDIRSRDELGVLARALNSALAKLKERFEMLKFLPQHTVEMIATSAEGDGVSRGGATRIKLAILESDIRGFTKLSSQRSPEEVISMLNTYLSAQAEVVAAHRGIVDKFMGDAVLAVFMGADQAQRAHDCALEIQRRVAAINRERAPQPPIGIGVGLSIGDVVMGNMGSEDRLEYSVIGSPVNLAARLCNQAAAGEVVMPDEIAGALSTVDRQKLAPSESLLVKGYSEPIVAYRIAALT